MVSATGCTLSAESRYYLLLKPSSHLTPPHLVRQVMVWIQHTPPNRQEGSWGSLGGLFSYKFPTSPSTANKDHVFRESSLNIAFLSNKTCLPPLSKDFTTQLKSPKCTDGPTLSHSLFFPRARMDSEVLEMRFCWTSTVIFSYGGAFHTRSTASSPHTQNTHCY